MSHTFWERWRIHRFWNGSVPSEILNIWSKISKILQILRFRTKIWICCRCFQKICLTRPFLRFWRHFDIVPQIICSALSRWENGNLWNFWVSKNLQNFIGNSLWKNSSKSSWIPYGKILPNHHEFLMAKFFQIIVNSLWQNFSNYREFLWQIVSVP